LLWDVAAGTELPPLPSPDSRVVRIAFSPDGTLLATAGQVNNDAVVRIWKVATGQLLFTSHGPAGGAWEVAFSPDGKTLAAGRAAPDPGRGARRHGAAVGPQRRCAALQGAGGGPAQRPLAARHRPEPGGASPGRLPPQRDGPRPSPGQGGRGVRGAPRRKE